MWKGERLRVGVMGATGSVGQRLVALLGSHPWFEPHVLTASERSAGAAYRDAANWVQSEPLPGSIAGLEVRPTRVEELAGCPLVLSALDARIAGEVEEPVARAGHVVVSNARSHRMDPRVPLVVPEVNPGHLDLARHSAFGAGAILTNPNCSTIGLALALKPLVDAFGVERAVVVTMQAVSGAGLPGLPSLQILDNVIPHIEGEEEKMARESRKVLGRLADGGIEDHPLELSAQCNRVPVVDGHTQCVSLALGRPASEPEVRAAFAGFTGEPQRRGLPSAPARPLELLPGDTAPQPRLHRDRGRGMTAVVGRVRPCPVLDWRFVTLSHNTLRGAAGGSLLLAELAVARGLVPGVSVAGVERP